jgi:hypothetical protein
VSDPLLSEALAIINGDAQQLLNGAVALARGNRVRAAAALSLAFESLRAAAGTEDPSIVPRLDGVAAAYRMKGEALVARAVQNRAVGAELVRRALEEPLT